jgi:hypothetical protein
MPLAAAGNPSADMAGAEPGKQPLTLGVKSLKCLPTYPTCSRKTHARSHAMHRQVLQDACRPGQAEIPAASWNPDSLLLAFCQCL